MNPPTAYRGHDRPSLRALGSTSRKPVFLGPLKVIRYSLYVIGENSNYYSVSLSAGRNDPNYLCDNTNNL